MVQIRTIDKNSEQSTYSVLSDDGEVSNNDILEETWMVIRILVVPRTCLKTNKYYFLQIFALHFQLQK